MEHQDFTPVSIHNPQKIKEKLKLNTPNNIIPKKKNEQVTIKTDSEGEIIKIKKITPLMSNLIKNKRNELKISQKELAQKTNLPIKTINDIERCDCLYNADEINKISKILNVAIPRI